MVGVLSAGLALSVTVYSSRCVTDLARDEARAWTLESVIARFDMLYGTAWDLRGSPTVAWKADGISITLPPCSQQRRHGLQLPSYLRSVEVPAEPAETFTGEERAGRAQRRSSIRFSTEIYLTFQ